MQPLDVGVFSSMKAGWRSILTSYKQKHPNKAGIDKSEFPTLLKQLMDTVKPGRHLPRAFEKCGLFPVNQDKPMERIPSRHMALDKDSTRALLNATFGEKLEQLRGVGPSQKKKRGKKVAPGKSYCEEEEEEEEETEDEDDVDVDDLLGAGEEAEARGGQEEEVVC